MSTELAIKKNDIVDVVSNRVQELRNNGEIDLPPNYSVGNALKSAWLELQETKTKSGKPALDACTNNSICNSLLDMTVQGLTPAKEQGYFIPYGKKLVFQRSYFGTMAVTKRVTGAQDIYGMAVFESDELDYKVRGGRIIVPEDGHSQTLKARLEDDIIAAYAVIDFGDERPNYTELMTIDQLKQAWAQGNVYKEGGNGTHQKFTDKMARKTVINRACKRYINSSDDSNILQEAFNSSDISRVEEEAEQEIEENANSEVINIEPDQAEESDQEQEGTAEEDQDQEEKDDDQGQSEAAFTDNEETMNMKSTGTEGKPPF